MKAGEWGASVGMQGEIEAWNPRHSTTPHILLVTAAPEGACAESPMKPFYSWIK